MVEINAIRLATQRNWDERKHFHQLRRQPKNKFGIRVTSNKENEYEEAEEE